MTVQIIEDEIPFIVTIYHDKGIQGVYGLDPDDSIYEVEKIEFEGQDFTNLLSDSAIERIKEKAWEQIEG